MSLEMMTEITGLQQAIANRNEQPMISSLKILQFLVKVALFILFRHVLYIYLEEIHLMFTNLFYLSLVMIIIMIVVK